jgi:hypothetical protein
MALSLRKFLTCIMVFLVITFPCTSAKETEGVLDKLNEQYDSLEKRGKFSVGVAVGFVGSRLALSSAVTAVKVAGVALVTYVYLVCSSNGIALDSSNLDPPAYCPFSQYHGFPIHGDLGRVA